jgi:hypothetical protein
MYWIKCDAIGNNVVLIWQQKKWAFERSKGFFSVT